MNHVLASFLLNVVVFGLAGFVFLRRYRSTVSKPARLQAFQYRLFALRDRAINLVVDGVMNEDDARWKNLYRHMNESAKPVAVDRMKNGLSFVLALLRNAKPPTAEEIQEFRSLPEPAKQLYADYVRTVLGICLEGSFVFRSAIKLADRFAFIKRWLKYQRPEESSTYRGFTSSNQQFCAA